MRKQVDESYGRRPGSMVGRYEVYDQSMQYLLCFFGVIIGAALECVNIATLSSFYILIRSVSFLFFEQRKGKALIGCEG